MDSHETQDRNLLTLGGTDPGFILTFFNILRFLFCFTFVLILQEIMDLEEYVGILFNWYL